MHRGSAEKRFKHTKNEWRDVINMMWKAGEDNNKPIGMITEQQIKQRLMGDEKDYIAEIEAKAIPPEWKEVDVKWVAPPPTPEGDKYRINDIAREHWLYIQGLLEVSLVNESYERDEVLKMIEFHYQTAMIHGWKHAMEVK